MEIRAVAGSITEIEADAIVVNLFEEVLAPGGATGAVDRALEGQISALIQAGEIKGKLHEITVIHTAGRLPASRVVVAGLGKLSEFDLERARQVAATVVRRLRDRGVGTLATIVHGAGIGGLDPAAAAQMAVEGACLGSFRTETHKTGNDAPAEIDRLLLVERDPEQLARMQPALQRGGIIGEEVNYARFLTNEPSNLLTPTALAEAAQRSAQELGFTCQVLGPEELRELGMNAMLAVARGSDEPCRLVVMRYQAAGDQETLGLVGKGLTFDSGGLNIKPGEGMDRMRGDMAGGADVLAAMRIIARLRPALNVLGVIGATENLPSGHASKPGDVIKSFSGKTVEIIDMDAEGRLVLADCLAYARRQGAGRLVDLATLAGATVTALGHVATSLVSNQPDLAQAVQAAAGRAGEKVWQMPLFPEYRELLKSTVADIKNHAGRPAAAVTGAAFLSEFVEDTPWAHLDIAGTSWSERDHPYAGKGPTGAGIATVVQLALDLARPG